MIVIFKRFRKMCLLSMFFLHHPCSLCLKNRKVLFKQCFTIIVIVALIEILAVSFCQMTLFNFLTYKIIASFEVMLMLFLISAPRDSLRHFRVGLKKEQGQEKWVDGTKVVDSLIYFLSSKTQPGHCGALLSKQGTLDDSDDKPITLINCTGLSANYICHDRGKRIYVILKLCASLKLKALYYLMK